MGDMCAYMRYTNTMTTTPDYIYHTTPTIDTTLRKLIARVAQVGVLSASELNSFLNACNQGITNDAAHTSKKQLIPRYMEIKYYDPKRWESWQITPQLERELLQTLRIKPRRTASGVATITILTKPWPCSSNCIFCPNDIRMPKSYMANEPACQRAEQCLFDPFLQTSLRLQALMNMGHPTDKIEIIILGGTWSDYPKAYQMWFVREVFRALNCGYASTDARRACAQVYQECGLVLDAKVRAAQYASLQEAIDKGDSSYNDAFYASYAASPKWRQLALHQVATLDDVAHEQRINESSHHRVVGLVIETRPDTITADNLRLMRALGATKVQMGIQVLNQHIRSINHRRGTREDIDRAFALLRLFGFKIHVHAMVNLMGSTPALDKADFRELVSDVRYLPDEVKLYPCVLVSSAHLCRCFQTQAWQAYTPEELVDVLVDDVLQTPVYTRISRMIRDIASSDIVAGNKKPNLRQLVETTIAVRCAASPQVHVREIRMREIAGSALNPASLRMEEIPFTTAVSQEYFLQWVDKDYHIAGFLRLSLPFERALHTYGNTDDNMVDAATATDTAAATAVDSPATTTKGSLPIHEGEAMIREVHVYGTVARVTQDDAGNAQHHGLGKQLVHRAKQIARAHGYTKINVISAVGTRNYYRMLGFYDNGLYQQALLLQDDGSADEDDTAHTAAH